jgi:hypothetical protein
MQVRYVFKPWFGEVPPYLERRRREQATEATAASARRAAIAAAAAGPPCQRLQGAELEALLRHLKLKWQSVSEAYQRLPCLLDTPGKHARKQVRPGAVGQRL